MTEKTERQDGGPRTMTENLGIVFLDDGGGSEDESGVVRAEMPVDGRTCQPYGILNGGASMALAEIVAGKGSMRRIPEGWYACGIQVSGNHVSQVPVGGKVVARGKMVHRGASVHVWNVDISTPEGRLVSTARVVNYVGKRK